MKRIIIDMVRKSALLFLVCLYACEGEIPESAIEEQPKEEEKTYLQVKDISGVWGSTSNKYGYIAIYPNGRYTCSLNWCTLISSGTYTLDKDVLTLDDGYTYMSSEVKITLSSSGTLTLIGEVYDCDSKPQGIVEHFKLNKDEDLSPSVAGRGYSLRNGGLNAYYTNTLDDISYESDNILKYEYSGEHKNTGKTKIIRSYTWRYVYRKPYTYCYLIDGEYSFIAKPVEIYDFGFAYTPNWGTLDFDLDDYRVEWEW